MVTLVGAANSSKRLVPALYLARYLRRNGETGLEPKPLFPHTASRCAFHLLRMGAKVRRVCSLLVRFVLVVAAGRAPARQTDGEARVPPVATATRADGAVAPALEKRQRCRNARAQTTPPISKRAGAFAVEPPHTVTQPAGGLPS